MQLDIFEHSRDVMLRNDALQAIEAREPEAARAARSRLAAEFPDDHSLAAIDVLLAALDDAGSTPYRDAGAASKALQTLRRDIEPAAKRLFGTAAGGQWLLPLWRQMALRAADLGFDPADAEVHAAALWLEAADWPAAEAAAAGIASWRRIPAPLAWMAEACFRRHGLDASWALLAELAWLSPGRFDQLMQRLGEPLLLRLRKAFEAHFEGQGGIADLAWMPAWLLTERPALAPALSLALPGLHTAPERCLRVLVELLGLERQGRHRELVELRKTLRDLHASIYAAYMKTR